MTGLSLKHCHMTFCRDNDNNWARATTDRVETMSEDSDKLARQKVLVIDDDSGLLTLIRLGLERAGFTVIIANSGKEGLQRAYETHPDVIVLDVMMPEMDGWITCQRLRSICDTPIIMLTARSGQADVLKGLSLGADDYLVKPCSFDELEKRICSATRRATAGSRDEWRAIYDDGILCIDLKNGTVTRRGEEIRLTPTESRLLMYLVSQKGRIVPHRELLISVWGPEYADALRYPSVYIRYLRRKIEDDSSNPHYIRTRWRMGYYFAGDGIFQPEKDHVPAHGDEVTDLREEIQQLHLKYQELGRGIRLTKKGDSSSKTGLVSFDDLKQLVSGIVHDLRGGIGIIHTTVCFILDDVDLDNPLATDFGKIISRAELCEVIIRNLMALGGGETFNPTQVNVEEVVRGAFSMLEHRLIDVALVVDADPDTPIIMADEGQMKQVFVNLVKNAGEAMPDGGTITVCTRREDSTLYVEISDTGHGIIPENLTRVFDLDFTTKKKRFGAGLYIGL